MNTPGTVLTVVLGEKVTVDGARDDSCLYWELARWKKKGALCRGKHVV